jgi:MFS family permease
MTSISDQQTGARRWSRVLVVALLTALIAAAYGFGVYLFAQLVPDMRRDLSFGYDFVGTVTASGQLSFLVCALLCPWVVRRAGDAQVVIGSGLICSACLMGIGLVQDVIVTGALLIVLAGMSSAIWIPMIGIISRAVSPDYRGTALGLASAGTSYGVFVNSLLVPVFAPGGDWRTVWLLVGSGTVLVAITSTVVFFRLGLFEKIGTHDAATRSASQPHSTRRITQWVIVIWLTMFLLGLSNSPFQNYLSGYIRDELHYGVVFAAKVWGLIGFVGMFAGLLVGWLSDKIGLRLTMLLVYVSILVAALIFASGMSSTFLLAAGVLFALAFYPIFGLVPAYVSKQAADHHQAVMIFGVGNMCVGAGGMIGNYAGGLTASALGTFVWVYAGIALCSVGLMILLACLPKDASNEAPRAAL